jgi:S-formylglutathione hydrolase FrmB
VATGPIERPAPLQDTGITAVGESVQVTIPATRSHFAARPAWVWVPPAYVSGRVTSLPVVMLLGGTPGRTNDWLRSAYADRTAEAFAEHHDGLAPMLVMPDENGSLTGDTECVDGPPGNAETYLTEDVPAFMHSQFGAAVDDWAVAGFSEGGTCAAMLQLRHPGLFAAFGDFSGLTSPTLGESVDARATARSLFRGSMSAYLAHDPLTLLRQQHLHGAAYFEVGSDDSPALRAQRALVALARKSGLAVCSREIGGGGHTYALWQQAFADSLPVLSAEVALTANPPPQPGCTPLPRTKAGGTVLTPAASPTR